MELVFTTIAVIGGMAFSLAVALLVEELIFGKVLCRIFTPKASQAKALVER
jgi:ABC-type sugar transport system permease subunit